MSHIIYSILLIVTVYRNQAIILKNHLEKLQYLHHISSSSITIADEIIIIDQEKKKEEKPLKQLQEGVVIESSGIINKRRKMKSENREIINC